MNTATVTAPVLTADNLVGRRVRINGAVRVLQSARFMGGKVLVRLDRGIDGGGADMFLGRQDMVELVDLPTSW